LVAVFYRRGESWQKGAAVMYVNTVLPSGTDTANVEVVAHDDSVHFAHDMADLTVVAAPPLRTSDGRTVIIRRFASTKHGSYEAVAYVMERRVTPIIVLTARSKRAFDAALNAFARLVESYGFLTDSVTVH